MWEGSSTTQPQSSQQGTPGSPVEANLQCIVGGGVQGRGKDLYRALHRAVGASWARHARLAGRVVLVSSRARAGGRHVVIVCAGRGGGRQETRARGEAQGDTGRAAADKCTRASTRAVRPDEWSVGGGRQGLTGPVPAGVPPSPTLTPNANHVGEGHRAVGRAGVGGVANAGDKVVGSRLGDCRAPRARGAQEGVLTQAQEGVVEICRRGAECREDRRVCSMSARAQATDGGGVDRLAAAWQERWRGGGSAAHLARKLSSRCRRTCSRWGCRAGGGGRAPVSNRSSGGRTSCVVLTARHLPASAGAALCASAERAPHPASALPTLTRRGSTGW